MSESGIVTKSDSAKLRQLDEIIYEATTERPFYGWDSTLTEAGAKALGVVMSIHAEVVAGYHKPRTITTVEELDALGFGAVVMSNKGGDAYQWGQDLDGYNEGWYMTGDSVPVESRHIAQYGPFTVLYEPEATK